MAEEAAIDLTIKTGEAEKNTQSLKGKLKELKQQLSQLEEGSAEFNAVAKEAGKLEDKIGDINKRVRALASDTKRLDAFVGAAQGIAGGFAAAQGAIALFGAENEDLNKTLLKVQSSVALLNGVQQIANTLNKDSAFMVKLSSAAQEVYTWVVTGSTAAVRLFKLALVSLGIGAVMIAIDLLVASWEDLTKWISGSTDALDKNIEATKKSTEAMKSQQKQMEQNIKDFRDKELASLNEIKAIREAQGLDTVEVDKKIREARLRNGETETQLEIEEIKKRTDASVQAIKDKAQREQDEKDKAEEAAIKRADEWEQRAKDQAAQEEADRLQSIKDAQDFEDELRAEHKKEVQEEAREEMAEEERKEKEHNDNLLKLEKEKSDRELLIKKINKDATQNLLTQGMSFAQSIANLAIKDAKKNAIAMKAVAIVELAINTAKSISNAIAGATASATGTGVAAVVTTPLFIASQIATVLAAAAQAAAIIGAPIPNVNTSAPPPPPPSPDLSVPAAPSVPSTPQSIPIPQQVYVTETDISGTQHKVNVIENLSKIH